MTDEERERVEAIMKKNEGLKPICASYLLREKGWVQTNFYSNPRYGDVPFTYQEALAFEGRKDLLTEEELKAWEAK